jgi:flagellar biosynthesis/type III secretory pathway protein FliH
MNALIFTKKILRKIIPTDRSVIEKLLRQELKDCKRILDLGCGEDRKSVV